MTSPAQPTPAQPSSPHASPRAAPARAALEVSGLRRSYGSTLAVDGVSLRADVGESVGILGANGAGKTTLVEMIAGLRTPDAGRVRVLGLDPRRDRARLRRVLGVQLQQAQLHGDLTSAELIDLHRSFHPRPLGREELLELVELEDHARTRFSRLSGGQQQRLSVALALVGRPQVVILDELTTGLDPAARRRMWRTISRLRADGVTILLVSHAMEEVERLCDRVVVLDAGQVLIDAEPAEILTATGAGTLDEAFLHLTGTELEETA